MFVNFVSPKVIIIFFTIVTFCLTSCKDNNCPHEPGTRVAINEEMLPWLGNHNSVEEIDFISEAGTIRTVELHIAETMEEWRDCEDVQVEQIRHTFYFAGGDSLRTFLRGGNMSVYVDSDSLDVDFSGSFYSTGRTGQETELVNSIVINENIYEDVLVFKDRSNDNMNSFNYFIFAKDLGLLSFTYKEEIWLRE